MIVGVVACFCRLQNGKYAWVLVKNVHKYVVYFTKIERSASLVFSWMTK